MDFKYNLEFTDDCKNEILEIYEYISQNLASTEAACANKASHATAASL